MLQLGHYADALKAISDSTRLRILRLLDDASTPLCVCEVNDILATSHYNVSRNLKMLKQQGILRESKDGKWIFYFFQDPPEPFFREVRELVRAMPSELFRTEKELCRRRLALRENNRCTVGVDSEQWRKIVQKFAEEQETAV